MNLVLNDVKARRVEAARKFASRFSQLEWRYLCSYQWFLAGVSEGFDRGNFSELQAKAEKALVEGNLRKEPSVLTISASNPSPWFGFL